IAALLPPCTVAGHTVTIEKDPAHRPLQAALLLCAVMNSFVFDWLARLKTATHLSLYLLDHLPMPPLDDATTGALAQGALRLNASHPGYAGIIDGLHLEQHSPCLTDPVARWDLRASMDAAIARAYGLDRPAYAHILGSFNHKAWPAAPDLCLAAFDRAARPTI
ncbi:MAG: hypothetical protein AB7O80_26820, partial [Acetobacteraceae bacterium]